MGRLSITEKYWRVKVEEEAEEDTVWTVIYTFDSKPNSKFWTNLDRLKMVSGDRSWKSAKAIITRSKQVAVTALNIAEYYKAETQLIKGTKVEPDKQTFS